MRKALSIATATALEILSEPLTLLVLLSALVIAVLAPAFHYHQFGEATRMARDAGFSALFTCGSVVAVFGTVRTFRREIESGTLEMALVHPLSRVAWFLSKLLGACAAYFVFALTVVGVALVIVEGAAVGGVLAAHTGDIARLWGPCLAAGVAAMVVPLAVGAALNRFARARFVPSTLFLTLLLSLLAAFWTVLRDAALVGRLVPVAVLIVFLGLVLLAAAAAMSVRLKAHAAVAGVAVVLALLLPAIGNYYLSDALSKGGRVSWVYVGEAALVTLPLLFLFILLGAWLLDRVDLKGA